MGDILSQDDLDALLGDLGDLFPAKSEDRHVTDAQMKEMSMDSPDDAASETLSQDDIDKLLAEFGK